jgi:cardiolipin synthase
MNRRDLPNVITGLRLAMAPLLPWLMHAGHWRTALAVALLAAGSDLLDGWLARRYDWKSRLGGLLDPLADKLLLAMALLGLWWAAVLPAWVFALVLARDLLIVAGAAVWWRLSGALDAAPTWLGKTTTMLQLALVLFCLADAAQVWTLPRDAWLQVVQQLLVAVALLTIVSGVDYVFRYGAKTWLLTRNRTR